MVVLIALELLDLGQGSVGWVNAAWGVGALVAGTALAVLLDRGNLAAGLASGCLLMGVAIALPGVWPVVVAAYVGAFMIGFGYTFVEVAARTLLQRLGSDETLARVLGFLETSRLLAMALGSIVAPALVALLGVRGALLAIGAVLPLLALLRWRALRGFEIGHPISERHYTLLRGNPIFAPLPVDTLDSLSRSLVEVEAHAGQEVITQGDRGDRFYLIDDGEVEVLQDGAFRRNPGRRRSVRRDRLDTRRAPHRHRSRNPLDPPAGDRPRALPGGGHRPRQEPSERRGSGRGLARALPAHRTRVGRPPRPLLGAVAPGGDQLRVLARRPAVVRSRRRRRR